MVVGILNITLYIGGMTSLKDKRSVVKSILSKVRAKFNVSAAETGRQDDWKTVKWVFLRINEASHADSMLASIIRFVESDPRVEITDICSETIPV